MPRIGWLSTVVQLLRLSRAFAYMAIALAGAISVMTPPPSIASATGSGHTLQLVWAGLMAVSAAFCAWGALLERWVGEYVGLIPLASVAAVFGVSALSRGIGGWASGFFLIGFFWILVSRWQEVALLRVEAERITQAEDDPGGEE